MPEPVISLQQAIEKYKEINDDDFVSIAAVERAKLLDRFPLDAWPSMSLERYALGHEGFKDSFCYALEWESMHLSSIRGGSSWKLLIFWGRKKAWEYDTTRYGSVEEAWEKIRGGFLSMFQAAKEGRWDDIDGIEDIAGASALRMKALHLYFKDEIIPVYAQPWLKHFLRVLGVPEEETSGLDGVRLNRKLLSKLREVPELSGWETVKLYRLVHLWSDPSPSHRIVKIAPGENARFWKECREGEFICIGWDEIGDLRKFESEDAFRMRFAETFGNTYKNHQPTITKKAKEVWAFRELEPGDIVVANKGTSHVLAIGEVVAPGYEWHPERKEFKQIVRVKWDTRYEKDIPPQNYWGLVTLQDVPPSLYHFIRENIGPGPDPKKPEPVPPIYKHIEDALERKGQVILYGPPGTGKTYFARRFSVWWLLKRDGRVAAASDLSDETAFRNVERSLTTVSTSRRTWWVVANRKEWSWDNLFSEGKVEYRQGRLQRNFPLVQPGDLVVGYQSSPEKRIVALAMVKKGMGTEGKIELVPVAKVANGLTWEEIHLDPTLVDSEPVRFRSQGTLFALTIEEADHLLSLLYERNPDLSVQSEIGEGIAPLTRLTFHPSYSYEDFIEGFRPRTVGGDRLLLKLESGVFKRVCLEAIANPKATYVVLIDEINRANIAKVFGELITLLEKDKRGLVLTLPQSRDAFSIPPNVFLIGTMNTADRSIKLLDAALRRRFAFLELMPDLKLLQGAVVGRLRLDDFLEELNRRIAKREGREKQIGHSYLLEGDIPVTDPDEFARRFRQEILPLLQEYCYDDYRVLAEFIGPELVDRENQLLNGEFVSDSFKLIEALERELCPPQQ